MKRRNKRTKETRKKMSESETLAWKKHPDKSITGKTHTIETKRKMSRSTMISKITIYKPIDI